MRSISIVVDLHAAANNINLSIVAMDKQDWDSFCRTFRTAVNNMKTALSSIKVLHIVLV